jgi:peptide/nickel transport system substrate-binding protein
MFGRVTWRFLPEAGSRVAALLAGEVGIIKDVLPAEFDPINASNAAQATSVLSTRAVYLRIFPDSPQGGGKPLADVRVRQALNYGINVDAAIQTLLNGLATRTGSDMSPEFPGYDASVAPYPYDPDKAKQLLSDAGYPNGFALNFETWSSAGAAPAPVELAQAFAADLAKIGITATVKPVELNTSIANQNAKQSAPLELWSYGATRMTCYERMWGDHDPTSAVAQLLDDQVTAEIHQLATTTDETQANQLCSSLQRRVHDQALLVPLFTTHDTYAFAKDLNWKPRPDELILPWEVSPA